MVVLSECFLSCDFCLEINDVSCDRTDPSVLPLQSNSSEEIMTCAVILLLSWKDCKCLDLQYVWEVFSIRGQNVPLSTNALEQIGSGSILWSCKCKVKVSDQLMAFSEQSKCHKTIFFII